MPKPRYLKGYQQRYRPPMNYGCVTAIVIAIGIVLLLFVTALYPSNFDYREQNKAETYGNNIMLPPLGLFLLFMIAHGLITSIKRKELQAIPFIKEIGQLLLVLLLPFALLKPVLTGVLLFVNANIGNREIVTVEGPVVGKLVRTGKGTYSELYVQDRDNHIRELRTFPQYEKEYKVGDTFRMHMTRGSLGLLFIDKAP